MRGLQKSLRCIGGQCCAQSVVDAQHMYQVVSAALSLSVGGPPMKYISIITDDNQSGPYLVLVNICFDADVLPYDTIEHFFSRTMRSQFFLLPPHKQRVSSSQAYLPPVGGNLAWFGLDGGLCEAESMLTGGREDKQG